MTRVLTKDKFEEIVQALHNDCILAFPTDTVYGIGVLCNHRSAAERMKNAKKRPETKPFPVMVASLADLEAVAWLTDRERKLALRFMPGALTMVLRKKDVIDNGLDTVAVRIPNDLFALRLLERVGPMYVTSANLSGEPACNTDAEVLQQLDGRIDLIVAGEAFSKTASTIIDCTGEELRLLRQGDLKIEDINKALL